MYDTKLKLVNNVDSPSAAGAASSRPLTLFKVSKWEEIPFDLARKIAERIEAYEDFVSYGSVCKTWKRAIKGVKVPPSPHAPWLMLAESEETSTTRQLYNLFTKEIRHVVLPVPEQFHVDYPVGEVADLPIEGPDRDGKSNWRYFSTKGWLVCVTQLGINISLVNPSSKEVIQLPCVPRDMLTDKDWMEESYKILVSKFVLSKNPSKQSDFSVAMIFSSCRTICVWKNGVDHWISLWKSYRDCIDIIFYKNKLYGLAEGGYIHELGTGELLELKLVAHVKGFYTQFKFIGQTFLVECGGKLLVLGRSIIYRHSDDWKLCEYKTRRFTAWELNVETGELDRVYKLGNMAIFVGFNSSFSIEALPGRGCKPNCIYYTDSMLGCYVSTPYGGGSDMGVFDLSTGKIEDFYDGPPRFSHITPSFWIGGC